jgi:hypothetical protein
MFREDGAANRLGRPAGVASVQSCCVIVDLREHGGITAHSKRYVKSSHYIFLPLRHDLFTEFCQLFTSCGLRASQFHFKLRLPSSAMVSKFLRFRRSSGTRLATHLGGSL